MGIRAREILMPGLPWRGTRGGLRVRQQLLEGFELLKAGDLNAARVIFSQVIETNPGAVAAHLGLGRVYFRENDLQAALQCFQEALAHDPKSSQAKVLIARV